jgi:hypothetical protein
VHHRAQRLPPGYRVGPVQHDEPLARHGRGDHRVVERPDVGVETGADVLDVVDHGVDAGLHNDVGERLPALAVGVVDGKPGARVGVETLRATGLRRPAEAVLGAEDGGQVHPIVAVHHVDLVTQVGQDTGRVGDDADLLAA